MECILDKQWALKIGNARVQKIADYYTEKGYLTIINPSNHVGPDIIIVSLPDGIVTKVIEVTNYGKAEYYVSNEKLKRYIDSLLYFRGIKNVELELIISYEKNLSLKQCQELKNNRITVKVFGKQDLPEQKAKKLEEVIDKIQWFKVFNFK